MSRVGCMHGIARSFFVTKRPQNPEQDLPGTVARAQKIRLIWGNFIAHSSDARPDLVLGARDVRGATQGEIHASRQAHCRSRAASLRESVLLP